MDNVKRKKIIKTIRDAIVRAAAETEIVKAKTGRLAKRVGSKWEQSKPLQRKAQDNVRRATQEVLEFSKSVAQGVREGVRDIRKTSKSK
jgi:hypothetical protein